VNISTVGGSVGGSGGATKSVAPRANANGGARNVVASSSAPPVNHPASPPVNTLPSKSGNPLIDALLAGKTWWWHDAANAVSAPGSDGMSNALHALTFSFMSAPGSQASDKKGFAAMSANEQAAVRSALDYVASLVDVTFTEVASGGNLQFGTNNQGHKSSGYAYYPNATAANTASVYLANDIYNPATTDFSPGTSAFETLIHEIGHALGLKHPGNYNAGGGGTPGPYLPKAQDNTGNTVMSYYAPKNAVAASTVPNGPGKFLLYLGTVQPSSYQMLDIAALQYMYGGSATAENNSATTYDFSPTANNKNVFMKTVWNTNSGSVIDASQQTLKDVVDLRAGHFSSIGVRSPYDGLPAPYSTAALYKKNVPGGPKPTYDGKDNLAIAAGSHIDGVKAGSGGDTIVGNDDATNTIVGGAGSDRVFLGKASSVVTGNGGNDLVCLPKLAQGGWTIQFDANSNTYTCKAGAITDTISGVAAIKTWDGKSLTAVGSNLELLA
jgi:hypothetical protein